MFLFRLRNVTKTFKANGNLFRAVDDVSLDLPNNGLVSIVGKSGCGKSTLLNLLIGIEKPTSGSIVFNNKNIHKFSENEISDYRANQIAMIYQHYNLFDDFASLENIAIPLLIAGQSKTKADQRANDLLKRFNLERLADKKVRNLSGGEKQRIAILRALSNEPKVLLCDEPTGALDEKNSKIIMDELKTISSSKLVLMVSHNRNLVNKYSDQIIELKDGKVFEIKHIHQSNEVKHNIIKKRKRHKTKWRSIFLKDLFRKNIFKEAFSFISLTIGFASILLGIGFSFGSKESQKSAVERNLGIGFATVTATSYYTISNSPLQFKKNVCPDINLIDEYLGEYQSIVIQPNTNYFFSPYPDGHYRDEIIKDFEMVPLLDEFVTENPIYPEIEREISFDKLEKVLVNKEFLTQILIEENDAIDETFSIENSVTISYPTNNDEQKFVKDVFSYRLNLEIIGVVDEFSFMNTPKVYFSYDELTKYLSNQILVNISQFKGKNVSVLDYLNESKNDAPEKSYSNFMFLKNLSEYDELTTLKTRLSNDETILQIESNAWSISDSYSTFINSFKEALVFFLAISFLGVIFILGMVSLSNFLESKKQSAILTCLGAKKKDISSIYLIYNSIISLLSLASAILLSLGFKTFLNSLIYKKFGFPNLISIPYSPVLFIALIAASLLLTCAFTLIPIAIYKNYSISEELRDE